MRYLLDTNTLIYVLNARPDHQAVIERFDREAPENLAASSITLAELQYGVAKSRRRRKNIRALRQVLEALNVIAFDTRAAQTYGAVRAGLESAGTPIGPLDTLIAAHALSLGLTLVTSDVREFARVPRLRVESWIPG